MVMYEAGMLARSKAGHDKAGACAEEKEEKACTDRSRNI